MWLFGKSERWGKCGGGDMGSKYLKGSGGNWRKYKELCNQEGTGREIEQERSFSMVLRFFLLMTFKMPPGLSDE